MEDLKSANLGICENAASLLPLLVTRAGLTGSKHGREGPYDAGLVADLKKRLFPGEDSDIGVLMSGSDLIL